MIHPCARMFAVVLLLMIPIFVKGQYWEIRGGATFGTFSMKGLKDVQRTITIQTQELSTKVVESFPSKFGYDVSISHNNTKRSFGLFYTFFSTGGRVHYADYSGEIKFDQIVNGNSFGGLLTFNLGQVHSCTIYGGTRLGATMSTVKFVNEVSVVSLPDSYISENYSFKSDNLFLSPLLGAKTEYHNFSGFLEARYEWHAVKEALSMDQAQLQSSGDDVHADWDGLRISFGIGYKFQ